MVELGFLSEVPRPLGLEAETAEVAKEIRARYPGFFAWVQAGAAEEAGAAESGGPEPMGTDTESGIAKGQAEEDRAGASGDQAADGALPEGEPWLLDKADVEYFYHMSRPADVGCACPYGWVEKVERVVDQQYPMFGAERFPDLYDKAAHMLWLILKHEVFSDYNAGVAALSALVLLGRNGRTVKLDDDGLRAFILKAKSLIAKSREDLEYEEDEAISTLGAILKAAS